MNSHWIYASHPLTHDDTGFEFEIPTGERGWAVLCDGALNDPSGELIEGWWAQTLAYWQSIRRRSAYEGPYAAEVRQSLRAIHLLTHEPTGGIIAAPTTSLPEAPGGARNYDYRYTWLRDSGMIVSALIRAGSDGTEERRFLEFICSSADPATDGPPLPALASLDGTVPPPEECLPLAGYRASRPVRCGNSARGQLQLDALGNVLLAAKQIYERFDTREHWDTVQGVAEFLARNWQQPDHGLWEEPGLRQYTTGKVAAGVGLEFIAAHAEPAQAGRWRTAAANIRRYVEEQCRAPNGGYAAVAGGDAADVSAALYPEWAYTASDTPAMRATITALERHYSSEGILFHRHLEDDDPAREGAFLAATFWIAQYWIMRGELRRAEALIRGGLVHANDLGLFPEEVNPGDGMPLGNFPQSFVHAAFIGAAVDLGEAYRARDTRSPD